VRRASARTSFGSKRPAVGGTRIRTIRTSSGPQHRQPAHSSRSSGVHSHDSSRSRTQVGVSPAADGRETKQIERGVQTPGNGPGGRGEPAQPTAGQFQCQRNAVPTGRRTRTPQHRPGAVVRCERRHRSGPRREQQPPRSLTLPERQRSHASRCSPGTPTAAGWSPPTANSEHTGKVLTPPRTCRQHMPPGVEQTTAAARRRDARTGPLQQRARVCRSDASPLRQPRFVSRDPRSAARTAHQPRPARERTPRRMIAPPATPAVTYPPPPGPVSVTSRRTPNRPWL